MIKYQCKCGEINRIPEKYPFVLFKNLICNCGQKATDWEKVVKNPLDGIDVDKEYELIKLKQSKLSSAQRTIILQMKG